MSEHTASEQRDSAHEELAGNLRPGDVFLGYAAGAWGDDKPRRVLTVGRTLKGRIRVSFDDGTDRRYEPGRRLVIRGTRS